ncbi:MAG: amino acid ABC transporter permease [Planctomycetota bacterium]|jgi:polar amino acid transport system permease protein
MNVTASTWGTHRREIASRTVVTVVLIALFAALIAATPNYDWTWRKIWGPRGYGDLFWKGLVTTAWISALSLVLGLALGFAGGLSRVSRRPWVHQIGTVYVEAIRGTPLLVQIFVGYYCVWPALKGALQRIGLLTSLADPVLESVIVGVIVLGVFAGAYVTEIVRAAIESIDRGQWEAGLAQGMTRRQILRHVVIPQALRRMVPPMTGQFVSLVKDSSLLSIIGVTELTKQASQVQSNSYKQMEVYLPLALLYLLITFPLSRLASRLERRLA